MATRFYLKGEAATDLIAMTLGEFFAPTVNDFLKFCEDARPTPMRRESPWSKLLDMMRLRAPLRDPNAGETASADAGTLGYANRHRPARRRAPAPRPERMAHVGRRAAADPS